MLKGELDAMEKTSHPERIRENSESVGDWNLTDKDIDDINRVFPVSDIKCLR